jgi:hypothetical protein
MPFPTPAKLAVGFGLGLPGHEEWLHPKNAGIGVHMWFPRSRR